MPKGSEAEGELALSGGWTPIRIIAVLLLVAGLGLSFAVLGALAANGDPAPLVAAIVLPAFVAGMSRTVYRRVRRVRKEEASKEEAGSRASEAAPALKSELRARAQREEAEAEPEARRAAREKRPEAMEAASRIAGMTDIEMIKGLRDSRGEDAAQMEAYIQAAERDGDAELAELFRWAQADDRKYLEHAAVLLRARMEEKLRRRRGD